MATYAVNAGTGYYALKGQDVELLIHQTGALTKHTVTLAKLCGNSGDDNRDALITATFLTAAAAIEAILSEFAHKCAPELYADNKFRAAGAPAKFERLFHEPAPDKLKLIWDVRRAIAHSEPDNRRSGEKGGHLTVNVASEVAQYVMELADWVILSHKK